VDFDSILALEAEGSYTRVHCQRGTQHLISRNLQKVERELPKANFHRCHRAYVLNLHKVAKLIGNGGHRAILACGFVVPVSRRNWPGLRKAMQHL